MEILHYLNTTISHTTMYRRCHSICGNKNDTRDPYCHIYVNKKGGAWMGLKPIKMGVTGDSINTGSNL
jgi:hypothetical protein